MSNADYQPRVVIEGADEAASAIRQLPSEAKKQLKAEMRPITKDVVGRIRARAEAQGLHDTGALIRGIKGKVRLRRGTPSAEIASSTTRKGYPYPKVYEYGRGRTRAFFWPVVTETADKATQGFTKAIDRAIESLDLG